MDGSTGQNGDGPTGTNRDSPWLGRKKTTRRARATGGPTGTALGWAPKWGSEQFCRNLSSKTN